MTVLNTSGTFSGSFISGASVMYSVYGGTSGHSSSFLVGWFLWIYQSGQTILNENEEIAKVKLIVPHSQGQSYASSSVYPCL